MADVSARRTFYPTMWPYLELDYLAKAYRYDLPFNVLPNGDSTATVKGLVCATPAIYYCPSDRPGALWEGDPNYRARGNYAANFGPHLLFTPGERIAPFGWTASGGFAQFVPYHTRFADIKDGLSNTLLMAEIRSAKILFMISGEM